MPCDLQLLHRPGRHHCSAAAYIVVPTPPLPGWRRRPISAARDEYYSRDNIAELPFVWVRRERAIACGEEIVQISVT